jgi:site-specific DNA-cytosine methylase
VFENVTGLFTAKVNGESIFKKVLNALGKMYEVLDDPGILLHNSADYGVPQIRKRVIIMGVRRDIDKVSVRDLYNSVYSTLKDGIKEQYRLQDYDGYLFYVNEAQMREIYVKMADVVDEMYTDKQDLEVYFKDNTHNDYEDLSQKLQAYLRKTY